LKQAFELATERKSATLQWQIKYALAKTLEREGLYGDAVEEYKKAIFFIENQRLDLRSEEFRIGFFQDKAFVYSDLIELLVKNKNYGDAFYFIESSRSRSFLDILGTKALQSTKRDNPLVAALDSLDARLAVIDGTLKNKELAQDEVQRLTRSIDSLTETRQKILKSIDAANKELSSLVSVTPLRLNDVQEIMDSDLSIAEYYVTNKFFLIFVITKTGIQCVKVPTTASQLFIAALDLRQDLMAYTKNRYRTQSQNVYNLLIKPIQSMMTTPKLMIIPHGKLHYIPFSALMDSSGQFLIDKYSISYAPSASLLKFVVAKRKAASSSLDDFSFFALGNPVTKELIPLPAAEKEVENLSQLFSKKEILLAAQATETDVRRDMTKHDLLHFACHGQFNIDAPNKSALFLTADASNDGKLYVDEIFNLKLDRAQLVVLSACETGLSKIVKGDELIGFSRAFIYAGTPSIISSLWTVSDESTSLLMQYFYKNFRADDKPGALRKAQLQLKADQRFEHPYFWSAFNLVGDWR